MKVRNGFVSNSSSSSFCIYGKYFDSDELLEKVKTTNFLTEEELEEVENDDYELVEIIEEKTGLEVYMDEDCAWIGKSWSYIGDDETGRQFKENVASEIEKIFGPGSGDNCGTHDEEISN